MQSWIRAIVFAMLFSVSAFAAGAEGVWKLTYTTSTGHPREATLTLQVEGGSVSGTIEGEMGSAKIEQGQLKGDDISFTLVRQGSSDLITVTYSGKIEGAIMKLKMQYRDREPIEITARRVSG
jgi:hypothetical protein